jgi:hypothetical protein
VAGTTYLYATDDGGATWARTGVPVVAQAPRNTQRRRDLLALAEREEHA